MEDGLGLVFEQQGNTGAAAYNQPTLTTGDTPMDKIANAALEQKVFERNQKAIAGNAAARQQKAAEAALAPKDLSGWVNDTEELGAIGNEMKDAYTGLMDAGVSPTNYKDPKAREYQAILNKSNMILATSKQQEKDYLDVVDMISADPEKYDVPATMAKANEIKKIPLRQRLDRSFKEALVFKEEPLDILEPLADIKIESYSDPVSYGDPGSESSSNKLKGPELRAAIEANVDNPVRAEKLKKVLASGQFKDKKEYVDYLYKLKADEFKKNAKYDIKAPKTTIIDINNGNSEELINSLGTGTQAAMVPVYDVNGKRQAGKTAEVTLNNVTQLDDIKSTISKATAIRADTGEKVGQTGTLNLVSGAMTMTFVQKGTNRILPTNLGTYTYKKDGNEITITGDQASIESQLVELGIGEYKPMIFGKGSEQKNGKPVETDIIIPADAAAFGTNDKNKALTAAQRAYYIYKKRAKDLNKPKVTAAATTTATAKKTTIKRADIPAKAQAAGYTIEEYKKMLEKNKIKIID